MTDMNIASMPLPIGKPIKQWDELDHLIAETRAGEIAELLSSRSGRQTRNVYHWPDGSLIPAKFTETY